ncbi:hypothetical protein TWF103_008089 [Orbilia oligospora]|nr:hypothetical protein TWF103_008089 [Orbilia oligospora]
MRCVKACSAETQKQGHEWSNRPRHHGTIPSPILSPKARFYIDRRSRNGFHSPRRFGPV